MFSGPLDGKVALITGGARGLGREMALAFARAGARGIAITAFQGSDETEQEIRAELEEASAGIAEHGCKVLALVSDVASTDHARKAVSDTLSELGGLDILVNNAGKAGRYVHGGRGSVTIDQGDPQGFKDIIDTNVLGPFLMTHAAAGHMLAAGWGRIINISKRTDSMHQAAITPYGPSKAALEAATIAWAGAMFDTGVTVNSLSPGGAINTKFGTGKIPNRGADPSVIGPIAVWLASTQSDGITGCRYCADKWDSNLPPDLAAEGCREPAIFPKPSKPTPLTKTWS